MQKNEATNVYLCIKGVVLAVNARKIVYNINHNCHKTHWVVLFCGLWKHIGILDEFAQNIRCVSNDQYGKCHDLLFFTSQSAMDFDRVFLLHLDKNCLY